MGRAPPVTASLAALETHKIFEMCSDKLQTVQELKTRLDSLSAEASRAGLYELAFFISLAALLADDLIVEITGSLLAGKFPSASAQASSDDSASA